MPIGSMIFLLGMRSMIKKNEINFLNSQFQFRMFREQTHQQSLEWTRASEQSSDAAASRRVFYFEISKCGIQDFNSTLRFIWYNIHQVIGLLTDVSESCALMPFPSLSPIHSCSDAMHVWVNIEWCGSKFKFRLFILDAFQISFRKKDFFEFCERNNVCCR